MDNQKLRNINAHAEASLKDNTSASNPSSVGPRTCATGDRNPSLSSRPTETSFQGFSEDPDKIKSKKLVDVAEATPTLGPLSGDSSEMGSRQGMHRNSMVDNGLQEVNLAVLGRSQVGKSTFMQCALDSKSLVTSVVLSKKVSLEGSISIVRLIELDMHDIRLEENTIQWPRKARDYPLPPIDGVLLLFDITELSSVDALPEVMAALHREALPTVLVASKCDTSPKSWKVTPKWVDSIMKVNKNMQSFQTALCTPETHKRCISIMLRNVMLQRYGDPCTPKRSRRARAATSSQPTSPIPSSHISTSRSKHGRAASEAPDNVPYEPMMRPGRNSEPVRRPDSPSKFLRLRRDTSLPEHDDRLDDIAGPPTDSVDDNASRTNSTQSNSTEITLNTIDSSLSDLSQKEFLQVPHLARSEPGHDHSTESGVSIENLVDRLLAPPMSKQDSKFGAAFLCLYRIFASPSELLAEILQRFEKLPSEAISDLVRLSTQLRYLGIFQEWMSEYPGDFAHPATRHIITNFVHTLAINPQFATASKELCPCLDAICEDEDAEWAFSDQSRSRASTIESFLSTSSTRSANSTVTADSSAEEIPEQASLKKASKRHSIRNSALSSEEACLEPQSSQENAFSRILLNRVEDARSQAQGLRPDPRFSLDKIRWHQLIDLSVEQIASELTRIDWILYSSIRPRDLVRHVSLNSERKQKCKSLEHVNAMINHFNHVAFWVANMILIREKPKHRALMLERFMSVAWRLRQQNNYNSLGAIIAGINGTAVHRLSQTQALVSPDTRKQFMRLEILMATTKSHSAYRLGWQNTSSPRIPFLPLHRRDLVSAEAGNRTFIRTELGERINWKKFEIMGEVIIGIRESQALPYTILEKNREAQHLILNSKFSKDDDELYERSVQLEGQGVGENFRKKFNWLLR